MTAQTAVSGNQPRKGDCETALLALDHVTVHSVDLELTERFYCGLLGMHVGERPAIAVPGRWYYIGEAAVVHVLSRTGPRQPGPVGAIDHFAFKARGLAAFEERLRTAGQAFERRRLAGSGAWQIFLSDPDGARVELNFAADERAPAPA